MDKATLEKNGYISKKTAAVFDPDFTRALKAMPWADWLDSSPPFDCRLEYLETIHSWIHATKLNTIHGLDRFSQRDLIVGTTQSFDEFYFRYSNRRLRFFRGEYAYHRRIGQNWTFLEDEKLHSEDVIIVSWPFCSTGATHPLMKAYLDEAQRLRIPVLIDCAYFGTCRDLDFDFSHPAIEAVSFSVSKGLGLGNLRTGIRYSDYSEDFPIRQQNNYNHTVLADAKIGIYMMQRFTCDFIPEKYAKAQRDVCERLGLIPTPCMHLALGSSAWEDYVIDGAYNRLGIRELVKAHLKGKIDLTSARGG